MTTPNRAAASAAKKKLKVEEEDDDVRTAEDDESFDGGSEASGSEDEDDEGSDFGDASEEEVERPAKGKKRPAESEEDDEEEEEEKPKKNATVAGTKAKAKAKEDEGADAASKPKASKKRAVKGESDADEASDAPVKPAPKKKRVSNPSDSESEDLAPKKKTGSPPTVSQATIDFFAQLQENNNRDWFNPRKAQFDKFKKEFEGFASYVIQKMRTEHDPTIKDVEGKDALFRIYRDVRFGGLPYKAYISFAFSRVGKKNESKAAVYYVHAQPGGKSFIAGGLWQPDGPIIAKIRDHIAERTEQGKFLRRLVTKSEDFRKVFGDTVTGDDDADEFSATYQKKLKTAPKGFAKDHEYIDLLRLKSWTATKRFTDEEVTAPDFADKVVKVCGKLQLLIHALNEILDA